MVGAANIDQMDGIACCNVDVAIPAACIDGRITREQWDGPKSPICPNSQSLPIPGDLVIPSVNAIANPMLDYLSDPKSVVIAFAVSYSTWEQAMEVAEDTLENVFEDPTLKEQYRDILLKYCTHKDRKYSQGYSFSIPPTYGQLSEDKIDAVEYVSSNRVHVDTKELSKAAYRFVVRKTKDGWRIDSVKWFLGGEWKNTLIGS